MICHIGKPLAARGLLCLAVVNSGGKPCHGCRTSLCGKTGKIGSIQEFSILSCSFDLSISFQEGEARKFPVHCAVHFQPLRFAVRLSRGFGGWPMVVLLNIGVNLPFVKMIGRFVPKDWPPVDRRAKCAPQAGLPLFWSDRAKSPVFVVPFCSPGFTSQSTRNEWKRPTFWHKAAKHSDNSHSLSLRIPWDEP